MSITAFAPPSIAQEPSEDLRHWRDAFLELTRSRLESLEHEFARLNQQARETESSIQTEWGEIHCIACHWRRRIRLLQDELLSSPPVRWPQTVDDLDQQRQDLAMLLAHARSRLGQRR